MPTLAATGQSNRVMAQGCSASPDTVKTHGILLYASGRHPYPRYEPTQYLIVGTAALSRFR